METGPPEGKESGTAHADDLSDLAHIVRERREELGWSQARLAREAGLNAETVRMLEEAKTEPKAATLTKVYAALGLPGSAEKPAPAQ